jgi:hypothetical protein
MISGAGGCNLRLTHPQADLDLFWGNFSFTHSVFAISTLAVFAHSIIIGSVQDLYVTYIYILFLTAPPLFFPLLILAYSSLFCMSAPLCSLYLEGY